MLLEKFMDLINGPKNNYQSHIQELYRQCDFLYNQFSNIQTNHTALMQENAHLWNVVKRLEQLFGEKETEVKVASKEVNPEEVEKELKLLVEDFATTCDGGEVIYEYQIARFIILYYDEIKQIIEGKKETEG